MCGIFGCIGGIQKEDVYKCIKQISYRGPDALEVRQFEGATLAHSRLSILDTSDIANQPMSDVSRRYWIVYNGEVYNFLELRRELETLGYEFRTNSDTEVVLYAYIAWGEKFQDKCNGMWAIAIWDDYEKRLFLSRDRFGVKPLYYYEQDHNFYFASEMKAFFPIMHERKINYSIFEMRDYFSYEATENCSIRGIKKVTAGYCGCLENRKVHFHKWWDTRDHLVDVPNEYEEQVELFRFLFLDACKIRMRSDVPIGTALSGGVDSAAVVGAMSYLAEKGEKYINKDWQHTFVASMPGTRIDETKYAEIAAEYVGADINKVMVNANISVSKLFEYMYICEDPYITSPIPFLQTYCRIADSGIRVTLDGHGADEMFGGYSFDLVYAAMEEGINSDEKREIWNTYNSMVLKEDKISYSQFENIVECDKRNLDEVSIKGTSLGFFNSRLYWQTHKATLPTLLRCYDRYSMGNGLEIRMPFMDYRIASFALSIPWRSKVRNGYSKKIVRDMSAPFMDGEIVYRKSKIGFNSPMTEWLRGDMKEFILDSVHSRDFHECELLNPLNVMIMVDQFYSSKQNGFGDGENIWTKIVPYFWKKAMGL